jgi:maltose O-acetyltransferase
MLSYIIQLLFLFIPDTRFYRLKSYLLRLRGFQIANNVRVVSSVKMKLKYLSIGENSFIGHETLITGGDALVQIGKNVDIGPRCLIVTGTHEIGESYHRAGKGKSLPIVIRNGTWVGASTTILGNCCIGKGCVIAAGSLIRDNFGDDLLIGGVPGRIIRNLENLRADADCTRKI